MSEDHFDAGVDRRELLAGAGAGAALLAGGVADAQGQAGPSRERAGRVRVTLNVNGRDRRLSLDPRTTLLDALRDHLDLTGTKPGCNAGACGACTVHVDGRRQLSCLLLAVAVEGERVLTIEGLSSENGPLHPMQQAFVDHDALQCGYCTPGQIMSAVACVAEGHAGDDASVAEWMSGNLCRCGAYNNIVAAVRAAASKA